MDFVHIKRLKLEMKDTHSCVCSKILIAKGLWMLLISSNSTCTHSIYINDLIKNKIVRNVPSTLMTNLSKIQTLVALYVFRTDASTKLLVIYSFSKIQTREGDDDLVLSRIKFKRLMVTKFTFSYNSSGWLLTFGSATGSELEM